MSPLAPPFTTGGGTVLDERDTRMNRHLAGRRRRASLGAILASASLALALPPAVAAGGSCAGQFASVGARAVHPLGQNIVVPEVRALTLGGPNLGQEVSALLATADRNACPVPPPAP